MVDRRTFMAALLASGFSTAYAIRALANAAPPAGPAEVLLIRHGEETSGTHLNAEGRARAKSLPSLFPGRFAKPTAVFAAKSSSKSLRCVETIEPLAAALGLKIDDSFTEENYPALAKAILSNAAFANGRVLISWRHGTMPELAAALGVSNPPSWPGKQYDHIWQITYANGKATLKDHAQGLKIKDKGKK